MCSRRLLYERLSFGAMYHGRMADGLPAKKALLHVQVLALPFVARRRSPTHTCIHNITGEYILVPDMYDKRQWQ